jgi:hypothetical protein
MEKLGNHYLGVDFSISSTLLLIVVFSFMYIFRKKIFFFFYKNQDLEHFIFEIQEYLKTTYPQFKFDFTFINSLQENNPDAKKYEILDNIIMQYMNYPYKPNVTKPFKEKLWDSYVFFSKPDGTKQPKDWMKRKNAVLNREDKRCQRCSKKITLLKSDLLMIKPIDDKGTYYLENLVIVCNDCIKIEKSKKDSKIDLKTLTIKENLYTFIK